MVSEPAVLLDSVVAFRGPFAALAGCNMLIERATAVAVKGANGVGKTSMLRLVAGLLPLHRGRAEVFGTSVRDRRTVRLNVAMVGAESMMYADLSPRENLRFFVRLNGAELRRIEPAFDRLEVPARTRDLPFGQLSTGQRRRVELARMACLSRPMWLLDEPHSGLDFDGQQLVDDLIDEAVLAGVTVLYTSHQAVIPSAHRVIEMVNGQVVQ